jgi:hypothetical protein
MAGGGLAVAGGLGVIESEWLPGTAAGAASGFVLFIIARRQLGGQTKEDDGADDGGDGGDAADGGGGIRADTGDFVAGVNVRGIEQQQADDADGGFEHRAEQRTFFRAIQPGHGFDDDFGLFDDLFLGNFDVGRRRIRQLWDPSVGGEFLQFLQRILDKFGPLEIGVAGIVRIWRSLRLLDDVP